VETRSTARTKKRTTHLRKVARSFTAADGYHYVDTPVLCQIKWYGCAAQVDSSEGTQPSIGDKAVQNATSARCNTYSLIGINAIGFNLHAPTERVSWTSFPTQYPLLIDTDLRGVIP
jgi:hypothetical protein